MAAIQIKEWDEYPIGRGGLDEATANRLHALAEREKSRLSVPAVLTRTASPGLKAGQVVGVLTVPGASMEILPKLDEEDGAIRRSLTRMLAVALRLPIAANEWSAMATQQRDWLEILVQLFTVRLQAAARRGLPRRYQSQAEDLPLLRGKLDIRKQIIKDATNAAQLACVFDELSVDTPLNRVLKAAIQRLARVSRVEDNRRRLVELAARFEFVGDSSNPLREPVKLDRTNTLFHRLHTLARLFLAGDWQSAASGKSEGFGLLFAMNDLFEVFVGRSMQAALSPREVNLQHQSKYALANFEDSEEKLFLLKPDIVVDGDIVVDTKWKRLDLDKHKQKMDVAEGDVYQMLAYAQAYNAKRLILLYPWHRGLRKEAGILRRWRVSATDIVFDIATVDVGRPDEVQQTLRDIVDIADPANNAGIVEQPLANAA